MTGFPIRADAKAALSAVVKRMLAAHARDRSPSVTQVLREEHIVMSRALESLDTQTPSTSVHPCAELAGLLMRSEEKRRSVDAVSASYSSTSDERKLAEWTASQPSATIRGDGEINQAGDGDSSLSGDGDSAFFGDGEAPDAPFEGKAEPGEEPGDPPGDQAQDGSDNPDNEERQDQRRHRGRNRRPWDRFPDTASAAYLSSERPDQIPVEEPATEEPATNGQEAEGSEAVDVTPGDPPPAESLDELSCVADRLQQVHHLTQDTGYGVVIDTVAGALGAAIHLVYVPSDTPSQFPPTPGPQWLSDSAKSSRFPTDLGMGVAQAVRQSGAGPGNTVLFIGHGQGGLIAAGVAGAMVRSHMLGSVHVLALGSPISHLDIPGGVEVTAVEHSGDPIPAGGGMPNPDTRNWHTITRD
jgi:hypothetical protein